MYELMPSLTTSTLLYRPIYLSFDISTLLHIDAIMSKLWHRSIKNAKNCYYYWQDLFVFVLIWNPKPSALLARLICQSCLDIELQPIAPPDSIAMMSKRPRKLQCQSVSLCHLKLNLLCSRSVRLSHKY